MEFFRLGAKFDERALFGGNRSGKTVGGGFETTCQLTGLYPEWWEGARFDTPIEATAATDTAKNARDILQALLVGPPGNIERQGTGLIPGDLILRTTPKHGIADAIETVFVRHASGGSSTLQFKSYDQGREAFQGTSRQFIWLDEEPPIDVYAECLMRLMTVQGLLIMTVTPLRGLTPLMLEYLPELAPKPKDGP